MRARQARPWCLLILFCYYEHSVCRPAFKILQVTSEPQSPLPWIPQRSGRTRLFSQALPPFYGSGSPREGIRACHSANFQLTREMPISSDFRYAPYLLADSLQPSQLAWRRYRPPVPDEWGSAVVLPTKPTAHYLYAFPVSLWGLGWVTRLWSQGVKIPGQAWPQFSKCTKYLTAYIVSVPGMKLGQHHLISKVCIWNVL